MSIRILDSPEPLSAQSMLADVDCILVQSDASRLLVQELKRYRNRHVTGRSFLIAGHRGSGKTTLVLDAYLRVLKESQRFSLPNRLLLVPLHGPNLLPDTQEAPAVPGADESERPAREADFDTGTQHVLKQITLALYRALAGEISNSYRQRVLELGAIDSRRSVQMRELLEISAQLELELYDCPDAARLREIWDRGGFLHTGVLSPVRTPPPGMQADTTAPDRGFLEIVALASACEAYKRVAGTYTSKDEQLDEAKNNSQVGIEVDASNKDLWSSLIAIATGGLAGAAMFDGENGVMAALGGLVAAIGSAVVIKFSSTRSRDRSRKREQTFVFDLSTPTLDRILPMICERVARAGLMPVFMVDELDKVNNLQQRMGGMVRHLKKFVAESAFFCFLTDRSYFEQLRQLTSTAAHPPEETYFKHPLVIVFTARDLHAYLERMIERPNPQVASNAEPENLGEPANESEAAKDAQAEARAEQVVAQANQQQAVSIDLADYPVIGYVLLHRARLHAGGLQRELAALTNQNGEFALPPGRIRTLLSCRFDVLIQLAIEYLLDQKDLSEALEREPERRMLVHDAMYFVSREWAKGKTTLNLSEAERPKFRKYLLTRIASSVDVSEAANGIVLSEDTEIELLGYVRELAALIAAPADLKDKLTAMESRLDTAVLDAIPLPVPPIGVILEADPAKEHCYHWRYRYTGQKVVPGTPAEGPIAAPTTAPVAASAPGPARVPAAAPIPVPAAVGSGATPEPIEVEEVEEEELEEFEEFAGKPVLVRESVNVRARNKARAARLVSSEPWQDAVKFIRAYNGLLKEITGGLINFTALSTQFRVIRTSPAWEEVARAMERLDKNVVPRISVQYREFEDDVACVIEFESLLNESMGAIGAALVCGALIGRASRSRGGGRPIYLGLKAIADAYGFKNASEGEVYRSLEQVGSYFKGNAPFHDLAFPWGLVRVDFDAHEARLTELLGRAGKFDIPKNELADAQRFAWEQWQLRVPQITGPMLPISFPPSFGDLLCAAADQRPSNLLQCRPDEMSARSWSQALYWSLADVAPTNPQLCKTWLAPAAARALGLSVTNMVNFKQWLRNRAESLKEEEWSTQPVLYGGIPLPPKISALIVVAAKDSMASNWLPGWRGGALLLSAEQVERLLKSNRGLANTLGIEHVVFEEPVEDAAEEKLMLEITTNATSTATSINLWRLSPRIVRDRALNLPNRMPEVPRPNQLVAPKDLDEMFEQIETSRGGYARP